MLMPSGEKATTTTVTTVDHYYMLPALHVMLGTSMRRSSFPFPVCQILTSPLPTVANRDDSFFGNMTSFTALPWHVFNKSGESSAVSEQFKVRLRSKVTSGKVKGQGSRDLPIFIL